MPRRARRPRFITPALGELLFWIMAGTLALSAIATAFAVGAVAASIAALLLIIPLRVAFELVLVIFACHEELERIRMHLEAQPASTSPTTSEENSKGARARELAAKMQAAREIDRARQAGKPPPAPGEHRLE